MKKTYGKPMKQEQKRPKCKKCNIEYINVMNGNTGNMEKRCGCEK